MATSGFNFQAAQQYLQQENARATAARKDNATYNDPSFPALHDRRCMAVALGSNMYNIDFMDGEGDMVVALDELILDNPPERVDVDTEPKRNVTQEEKEARAESEIPSRIRILICGDREWDDITAIKEVLEELPRSTIIIHGDDIGVDTIVARCAILCGMEVKSYAATNGTTDEEHRTMKILEESNPDVVIYFHNNNLTETEATKNMIEQAEKYGAKIINWVQSLHTDGEA
tara:strand:+ start:64 stop:756 length:693 start_codon:yes stop_codon:yes gene_type:complete